MDVPRINYEENDDEDSDGEFRESNLKDRLGTCGEGSEDEEEDLNYQMKPCVD